jgi:hypothetical protein
METKLKQIKKFDKWMRKTVQSIHYSNNEKMSNAYQKIKI